MSRRTCRCQTCFPQISRPTNSIPFHRRPRVTPNAHSDPSARTRTETNNVENSTESTEHQNPTTQSDPTNLQETSSPIVTSSVPSNVNSNNTSVTATNEKTTEWTASTPNSVNASGPPSVLAPITNHNTIQAPSPAPVANVSRGLKRSATIAFDDQSIIEDDERERHQQAYDFHRTDTL